MWLSEYFAADCLLHPLLFRFVQSVLPPGNEELNGSEVDSIIRFKSALGIDDPEAAAMHMEVLLQWSSNKI